MTLIRHTWAYLSIKVCMTSRHVFISLGSFRTFITGHIHVNNDMLQCTTIISNAYRNSTRDCGLYFKEITFFTLSVYDGKTTIWATFVLWISVSHPRFRKYPKSGPINMT
jgi:hypothetical protein